MGDGPFSIQYSYDSGNRPTRQLTTFDDINYTYSAAGQRLRAMSVLGGANEVLAYDPLGRLVSDQASALSPAKTFRYNPMGELATKTVAGVFERIVRDRFGPVEILDANGTVLHRFEFGRSLSVSGSNHAIVQGGNTGRCDITLMVDDTGQVTGRKTYHAGDGDTRSGGNDGFSSPEDLGPWMNGGPGDYRESGVGNFARGGIVMDVVTNAPINADAGQAAAAPARGGGWLSPGVALMAFWSQYALLLAPPVLNTKIMGHESAAMGGLRTMSCAQTEYKPPAPAPDASGAAISFQVGMNTTAFDNVEMSPFGGCTLTSGTRVYRIGFIKELLAQGVPGREAERRADEIYGPATPCSMSDFVAPGSPPPAPGPFRVETPQAILGTKG